MNLNKINPWIAGIALIFSGSLLYYFEDYKNDRWLSMLYMMAIFVGWLILFIRATKNTSVDAKKIAFASDKAGWFKQAIANLFFYAILIGIIGSNTYLVAEWASNRKHDILDNQPTQTTVAEVVGIDERRSRSSTSYYAIFEYTVNGKIMHHSWHERNESDFIVSEKYMIRYSVEYPEMFRLLKKLR